MKEKIAIFSVYHQLGHVFKSDLITQIQSGRACRDFDLKMLKDNIGDNISDKNKYYGELTANYWVWKNYLKENPDIEYIGFCHYRRWFDFDNKGFPTLLFEEIQKNDLTKIIEKYKPQKIYETIKDFDVVISVPCKFEDMNISEQWKACNLSIEQFDVFVQLLLEKHPEMKKYTEEFLMGKQMYIGLVNVMKKNLFIDFQTFIFDLLFEYEKRVDITQCNDVSMARVPAFLAERFFNVWLMYQIEQNGVNVLEVDSYLLTLDSTKVPQNQKTLISIVVTSYNYQDYIKETLESLVNQTYDNFEIIIVDDGSKDDSVEIIKEYAKKDSRITLLQHPNGENRGIAESVRVGVERCKGEYVAFCESDDYWALNHLEEKVKYINKFPDVDIIPCLPKMFGVEENVVLYTATFKKLFLILKNIEKPCNIYSELLKAGNIVFATFSIMMIKRSKLIECDFCPPVMKSAIDIWLWKQLLVTCTTGFVDQELTFWRKHEKALSWQNNGEDWDIFGAALNKILEKSILHKSFWMYAKLKIKQFYQNLFSIKNKDDSKVLTILGVNIIIKRKQKC